MTIDLGDVSHPPQIEKKRQDIVGSIVRGGGGVWQVVRGGGEPVTVSRRKALLGLAGAALSGALLKDPILDALSKPGQSKREPSEATAVPEIRQSNIFDPEKEGFTRVQEFVNHALERSNEGGLVEPTREDRSTAGLHRKDDLSLIVLRLDPEIFRHGFDGLGLYYRTPEHNAGQDIGIDTIAGLMNAEHPPERDEEVQDQRLTIVLSDRGSGLDRFANVFDTRGVAVDDLVRNAGTPWPTMGSVYPVVEVVLMDKGDKISLDGGQYRKNSDDNYKYIQSFKKE